MKRALIIAGVVAALPFGSALAAQHVAQPPYTKADIADFRGNEHSLIDALRTIQSEDGGRVLEIRFADRNGVPGYQAVVAKGEHLAFVRLDEGTGHTVQIAERPDWMMNYRDQVDAHLAEHAKVPLAKAIRTAEDFTNGAPAVAAGIARSASHPGNEVKAYNILVDVNGNVQRIAIDDDTGQVIANPDMLSG